ncbi:hypothetical protein QAD02_002489 [Eretmocerus hayati]|uniref:Uncharacterized protein n=1 Tax=Eretmocerus hayati TaxID=131215 RepID=A0ACC2NJ17_9HYME|nr:hypothetical protein QAD02_002489 [Eretmocerus hayati]
MMQHVILDSLEVLTLIHTPSWALAPRSTSFQDTNLSESDDRSSILVASGSKMYISGSIREKRLQTANTPEQFSFSDTKTAGYSERSSNTRSTKRSDRKSSHHQFSRISRQISYQEDEYNDETENKNGENIEEQMRLIENDPLIRINRIDGGGNGIASRAGLIEMKEEDENIPESFNPQNTAMKISKSNSKSAYHFRLRMLVESFVLNMPDICAICLQQFGSYLDVLKHKICSHMSSEQEYYFCPVCHDKFFSSSDLIVHLDGHANIQSFICTICSTNFYTDETLR